MPSQPVASNCASNRGCVWVSVSATRVRCGKWDRDRGRHGRLGRLCSVVCVGQCGVCHSLELRPSIDVRVCRAIPYLRKKKPIFPTSPPVPADRARLTTKTQLPHHTLDVSQTWWTSGHTSLYAQCCCRIKQRTGAHIKMAQRQQRRRLPAHSPPPWAWGAGRTLAGASKSHFQTWAVRAKSRSHRT